MTSHLTEKEIIQKYQQDEKMMILAFAQWCRNNELDPQKVYTKAYPHQEKNPLLIEAVDSTLPKEESDVIPLSSLLSVLEMYGNEELCFVITEILEKK
ncbi:hypothetical protein FZC84_11295 [Rossellomorea vietnamensis]|uniref:Uncharacterized protein n=1 Tax=Rossellomorea vietnamensis TaxID=218284 RepID=A0A5D4MCI3_9BACI|nr:hypothetical protein [Rossellomorea vietnamensis]TYR99331.1 hypothetical protein FZC84_11295 [Rossellomorea vietnamensis]